MKSCCFLQTQFCWLLQFIKQLTGLFCPIEIVPCSCSHECIAINNEFYFSDLRPHVTLFYSSTTKQSKIQIFMTRFESTLWVFVDTNTRWVLNNTRPADFEGGPNFCWGATETKELLLWSPFISSNLILICASSFSYADISEAQEYNITSDENIIYHLGFESLKLSEYM